MAEKKHCHCTLKIIVLVLLVLLAAIGVTLWKSFYLPKVDSTTYQAVFLDNGQQYFGHLNGVGRYGPYLTDIYYVQSQMPASSNPADQKLSLVKLGKELHGPEDKMYLNWKHVIFWENLTADSQVVKGIAQEKLQRANPQAVAPAPVAPAAPAAPVAPTSAPIK
ncbi:hypothetical protein HZA42_05615 [Candidatus Peregrinibacteria bacterium]|nr:hypothetical protein [Candidatus Peregrinibacteria bacterium]